MDALVRISVSSVYLTAPPLSASDSAGTHADVLISLSSACKHAEHPVPYPQAAVCAREARV